MQKVGQDVKMTYGYVESPNKSSRKNNDISGIVAHFTAGGALRNTVRYMCNKIAIYNNKQARKGKQYITKNGITYYNARASAHYITGRSGKTVQLVPESMAAWHAGSSSTTPKLNGKKNLNLWTIGHEICNWGPLYKHGNKFYCWPNSFGKLYTGPKPVRIIKKYDFTLKDKKYFFMNNNNMPRFPDGIVEYWEPYTNEQINAILNRVDSIIFRT